MTEQAKLTLAEVEHMRVDMEACLAMAESSPLSFDRGSRVPDFRTRLRLARALLIQNHALAEIRAVLHGQPGNHSLIDTIAASAMLPDRSEDAQ